MAPALLLLVGLAAVTPSHGNSWTYDRRCLEGVGDDTTWKRRNGPSDENCELVRSDPADYCSRAATDDKWADVLKACPRACGQCPGVDCASRGGDDPAWARPPETCADVATAQLSATTLATSDCGSSDDGGNGLAAVHCPETCCPIWDPTAPAYAPPIWNFFRIACIGDSNVVGVKPNRGPRQDPPWPETLEVLLGPEIVNYGQSGTTALASPADGQSMLASERYQDLRSDITAAGPGGFTTALGGYDMAIVLLGTNDAKEDNLPLQRDFVADYLALVDDLVATMQPRLKVLLIGTPVPIFPQSGGVDDKWTQDSADFNNGAGPCDLRALLAYVTARAQCDHPGIYVGTADFFGQLEVALTDPAKRAEYYEDVVHPGPAGAVKMADAPFYAYAEALGSTFAPRDCVDPGPSVCFTSPPTAGPTPGPTAGPTPGPTAGPTLRPTPAPVLPPVAPSPTTTTSTKPPPSLRPTGPSAQPTTARPSFMPTRYPVPDGCEDKSGRVIGPIGRRGVSRGCSWIGNRVNRLCGKHISARENCPASCGLCFLADKTGSKDVRDVAANRRAKKSCTWVKRNWVARCSKFPKARRNCRVTCNTPVDCNDAVGSFATTSHGTKTCDDVFEVWKARGERNPSSLYRDPLARENCPVTTGTCTCSDLPYRVVDLDGDEEPDIHCKRVGDKCGQGNSLDVCPQTCDSC